MGCQRALFTAQERTGCADGAWLRAPFYLPRINQQVRAGVHRYCTHAPFILPLHGILPEASRIGCVAALLTLASLIAIKFLLLCPLAKILVCALKK